MWGEGVRGTWTQKAGGGQVRECLSQQLSSAKLFNCLGSWKPESRGSLLAFFCMVVTLGDKGTLPKPRPCPLEPWEWDLRQYVSSSASSGRKAVFLKRESPTGLVLRGNACFQPKVWTYSIPNFDVCSNLLHQPLLCRIIWCILKSKHICCGTKLLLFPRKKNRSLWKSF